MTRPLSSDELRDLLGAYALDAVDEPERAQVETWLSRSPAARREVDELRETASLLGASVEVPPLELWSRIEAHLGDAVSPVDAPPLRLDTADLSTRRAPARTRSRRPWVVGIAAALALVVAVGVGVFAGSRLADQDARIDRLAAGMERRAMERAALAATMEPGARAAALTTDDGHTMAKVVVTADGRGYFMSDAMPALPAGRTYQLWAVMGDAPSAAVTSAGVIGRAPQITAFTTDAGVTRFVVTEEDVPGVVRSDAPAMLQGRLT